MTSVFGKTIAILATSIVPLTLSAQDNAPPRQGGLGTVHFETSCDPAVGAVFDRAIALLHSFEFGSAVSTFGEVLAVDPDCAMAWWGIALSRWGNPMVPNIRPAAQLERGREAAEAGRRLAARATEREGAYLAAVATLYSDHATRDQRERVLAYEAAMRTLTARFPEDTEAKIFHAISLVGSAPPTDKSYANQRQAGAELERLFALQPNHPGLAHYIIHSYDVPALASGAATAARRYASIAPAAAHALHMPSHTFTRVGMWTESVATNLRSMEAAMRDSSIAEALHAADYAVYANLQMRRDSAARALIAQIPALAARFDPAVARGAAPGSAGVFALAAMPARYALERGEWAEAAALEPTTSAFPYAEALTHFARALGAAHTGDTASARRSIDSLEAIRVRLDAAREAYWAEQVAIERLGAQAWLELTVGRQDSALVLMKQAAEREDATEKAAVTPGPLAPARELLGDMLMATHRPEEALAEYRSALQREPNRYRTLQGAAGAALAAGDAAAAAQYQHELRKLTTP